MVLYSYETGPCRFSFTSSRIYRSGRSSHRDLRFDNAADKTFRPFNEGQMVGQAAFKQYAHPVVPGNIGSCHKGDILRGPNMIQVVGFCQHKAPPCFWGLNFRKLFAEVFDKYVMETARNVYGLLADQFKSFIYFLQGLLGYESSRSKSLLYFRILGQFTQLLVDCCRTLRAMAGMAEHHYKHFLRVLYRHVVLLFVFSMLGLVQCSMEQTDSILKRKARSL